MVLVMTKEKEKTHHVFRQDIAKSSDRTVRADREKNPESRCFCHVALTGEGSTSMFSLTKKEASDLFKQLEAIFIVEGEYNG